VVRALAARFAMGLMTFLVLLTGDAHAQLTVNRLIDTFDVQVGENSTYTNSLVWTNNGFTNITGVAVRIKLSSVDPPDDVFYLGDTEATLFYNIGATNQVVAEVYPLAPLDARDELDQTFTLTNAFTAPIANNEWDLLLATEATGGDVVFNFWRLIVTGDAKTSGTIEAGAGGIISGSDGYTVEAVISAGAGTGSNAVTAFVTNGQSLNFDGGISGTGELAKTGAGTLTIGANSSGFSGTVRIAEGHLSLTNTGSLSANGSVNLSGATGVYDISAITAAGETNASLSGVAGSSVVLGGKNLSIGGNNADSTFAGAISGSGGSLAKTGTGTMTLTGDNTYTGGTLISGGVLQVGNGSGTGSLGSGNITNNAALAVDRSGALTMAQTISGTGTLSKSGTGTLTLSGANTYSGTTTLSGGTLRLANASALGSGNFVQTSSGTLLEVATTGTITNDMSIFNVSFTESVTMTGAKTLNNATIDVETGKTVTEQGVLSGDGGLTKEGGGAYILNGSADNTYLGATEINAGSLVLSNSSGNAIHSSSSITVNSGGTLVLGASNQIGDGIGLILGGGTLLVGAAGVSENLGTLTLTEDSTIDFGNFGTSLIELKFADSSGVTWANNTTLTITNWQGVAQTSSDFTRLFFGTNGLGLTEGQLGQIVFADQGINGGTLLGTGELVPVPEPKIYVAALAIFAAIGWRERKRLRDLLGKVKFRWS
jgi:autotransporter-associated beta strand protein